MRQSDKTALQVSVIIPHYNRLDALRETLRSLARQSLPPDEFEVIVVDDGSDYDVAQMLGGLELPFEHHLLYQDHKGAASARNLGVSQARGEFLLFLDTDMVTTPDLLLEHVRSHRKHKQALVTGLREDWPEAQRDPLVTWFESRPDGADVRLGKSSFTFQEAFTCNLSLRACHWPTTGGFDEQFPRSGFEDVEFAYRATRLGFEIILNPKALAYHNHPQTMQQYCRHEQNYQCSAILLLKKHPELRGQIMHLRDKEPIDWRADSPGLIARKIIRRLLALRPALWMMEKAIEFLGRRVPSPRLLKFLYWKIIGSYQLIGFQEGMKRYGWPV